MKLPSLAFLSISTALTSLPLPLWAGQYSQNFETVPLAATDLADGSVLTSTSLGANCAVRLFVFGTKELQLTRLSGSNTRSALLLPDLDAGDPIYGFTAKWDSLVQAHFPAFGGEGFSFNFGPLAALDLIAANLFQEDGFRTGGLSVGVRTPSTITPTMNLRVNNASLLSATYAPGTLWGDNDPVTRHAFEVTWDAASGLTFKIDGNAIFTNAATPGFTPQAGDRFAWGARTASSPESFDLDNIVVTTTGLPKLATSAAAPDVLPQIDFTASIDTRGQSKFGGLMQTEIRSPTNSQVTHI